MAQFTTYDQVGQKEDVSDVISNLSPKKTPFVSLIGTENIKARKHEWQEDELADVRVNANVEGFTASDATLSPTVMRENNTQILEKTFKVSATADAIGTHGRAKETAYQAAKASAEVKRDLEHAMVGTAQTAVMTNVGTARKMASVQAMIASGVTETAPDGDAGTGGTQPSALTETLVLNVNQKVYNAGSEATILMIKPADSLKVSAFAAASGRTRDFGNEKKIVNVVDLYVSPFGEQKVVIDRFIKSTDAIVFDPANFKRLVLRNWTRETLAKDGDNTKMMIVGEFSLKHVNFEASGLITNLS